MEKGITMETLVITVIVLIIVAEVSISGITGGFRTTIKKQDNQSAEFNERMNDTQSNITELDETWRDVTQKRGIENELKLNETTNDVSR